MASDKAAGDQLDSPLAEDSGVTGWVIGVMVELTGEPAPLRHYYAIGFEDRAKAEWTALDAAMTLGAITSSPFKGQEPVQTLGQLTPARMKRLGLLEREVRSLGRAWPRKWLDVV